MAHPGGRPLKYKTKEELQKAIDAYFKECIFKKYIRDDMGNIERDEDGVFRHELIIVRPITVTGLAIACGMTRQILINYSEKDEFWDTIKDAKEVCQQFAEEHLFTAKNSTGAIFSLKNNWKWVDKTEQDVNISGSIGLADRIKRGKERVNGGDANG